MLPAALALAALALAARWVAPSEVPGLLDARVLSLFFVLIVAVACARSSGLFARGLPVWVPFVAALPALALLGPGAFRVDFSLVGAFTGLLYGVNAGGCGTPVASLANLIGARIYLASRPGRRRFWRLFFAVSFALLGTALVLSFLLLKYSVRA